MKRGANEKSFEWQTRVLDSTRLFNLVWKFTKFSTNLIKEDIIQEEDINPNTQFIGLDEKVYV